MRATGPFLFEIHVQSSILPRYADQISVKMADGPKYSLQLFEEGCKRITAINVQYKGENETEWQATKTLAKH